MAGALSQDTCREHIANRLFGQAAPVAGSPRAGRTGSIGLELEAIPYRREPISERVRLLRPEDDPGDGALVQRLERLEFPSGGSFHLEPGAQVEIATAPCDGFDELETQLGSMQGILRDVAAEQGLRFAQIGVNPWFGAREVGLQVRKPRYVAMDEYFAGIGPFGRQMMRQTCSLQVNLDLGSERERYARRFLAASLLAPFATALFAHSSVVARRPVPQRSYRSLLWQRLDPARTGIVLPGDRGGDLEHAALVDAYCDFALAAPVLHVGSLGPRPLPRHLTLARWIEEPIDGIAPTPAHLDNHLSLLFPEVRPRGHVELRSVDVPPVRWQLVPAAFYAGILFCERRLEAALERLIPLADRVDQLLELAPSGLEQPELAGLGSALFELAIEGFSSLPGEFRGSRAEADLVAFHERFPARGRTLADEYREGFTKARRDDDSLLRKLEETYEQL